ncbi:ribonuclease Z, partial [Bacteroidota bacterium]
ILNHQIFFLEKLNFKIHFFHHENTVKGVVFENKKLCVEIFPLKHKIPTWGFMFREKPALPNIKKELVEKYKIPIPDIIKIKNGEDYLTKKGELLKHKNLVIPPSDPVSLAYCSDTMFNPDIIQYINKVNILYHEASFANEDEWRATDTQHSTGKQAALIAKQAKAGKLIIGHFSARYKNTDILLNECREIFPNTELAEEGRQFEI